jgi:uncharacterized Zn-binding protein involved in type VI secretion
MGFPAAKQGDKIVAVDIHLILPPPAPPVVFPPIPVPHPFVDTIDSNLSTVVTINGMAAATVGSMAVVMIEGKPAARLGDTAMTCNDPAPLPNGKVISVGTVMMA